MNANPQLAWVCAILTAAVMAMLVGRLLALRLPEWTPFITLQTRLGQLGYDRRAVSAWVWTLLLTNAAFATLGCIAFQLDVLVIGLAAFVVVLLRCALSWLIERRERLLRSQVCDAASVVAGALAAGDAPAIAVEDATRRTPQPLQKFLARITADYRRGVPLEEALATTERTLALDSFSLVSSAISVAMRRGGRITEALGRIAESLHQQQALDDKLAAVTASGRNAIATMSVFPVLFAAVFYCLDPYGYEVMLATPLGQAIVVMLIATMYIAIRWAKSILNRAK